MSYDVLGTTKSLDGNTKTYWEGLKYFTTYFIGIEDFEKDWILSIFATSSLFLGRRTKGKRIDGLEIDYYLLTCLRV